MGKLFDFYQTKIEQKFRKNGRNFRKYEVINVVKSTSKSVKILNEIRLFSFVHFCEVCLMKISLETQGILAKFVHNYDVKQVKKFRRSNVSRF